LVNQQKIGIIAPKILSYSPKVKDKIAFGNGLRFQAQIEDLRLKSCILGRNSKNNVIGRTFQIEHRCWISPDMAKFKVKDLRFFKKTSIFLNISLSF
jgi:hypothetical protein